jgi:hypothetical protein
MRMVNYHDQSSGLTEIYLRFEIPIRILMTLSRYMVKAIDKDNCALLTCAPPPTPSLCLHQTALLGPCALISSGSRRGDRYNQDNIAGSIPTWLRNLATKKALPSYIKLLQTQCHNQARRPWLPAHGCC